MITPNWQTTFRDLPVIPEYKKDCNNGDMTIEQTIALKMIQKKVISKHEEKIFAELSTFYSELNSKLITLNYLTFNLNDFENFKNYIFNAFDYIVLITNQITITQTYRLVVNEWVTGQNKRINNIEFLRYPTLDIVRQNNIFNRANTPNTNVFYSSENIDTTLKEIRPPENKLVSVGVWKSKSDKKLNSYPISHSNEASVVNVGVVKATSAFEDLCNFNPSLLLNYMRYYTQLLGREYTKEVNHHYEYVITAFFSEKIFQNRQDSNADFRYDCIIYPSIGNDYMTNNAAIRPSVIDNEFYLDKVFEFEVEKENYDKQYIFTHPEIITLAKVKNVFMTNKINKNGSILW